MSLLRRKIDQFLEEWKLKQNHLPLIVKGARQIGKTASILQFAHHHYKYVVNINFVIQSKYREVFADGFEVDSIIKNITIISPTIQVVPGETLIFFDEIQSCPSCATSLKSFAIDGRYDVICSGSLMGINYNEIESNSVGYKEDYSMHSMDFEEFLWAVGYTDSQISDMYAYMSAVKPLPKVLYEVIRAHFFDYMLVGGMPAIVRQFVVNNNFSGVAQMQQQLLYDYEEDITKYAQGLDKGKIKNIYNHIPVFLGRDNKKFQITKVAHGARSRDYVGTVEWLKDAGIVNVCYCLDQVSLPLKGNYNPRLFKLYYHDTGMLVASLDAESQDDLRQNRNYGTYKGGLFENIVSEMLVKQGYQLYFYRNDKSTVEMDFFVRTASSLVPVEVKASDNATPSLNNLKGKPDKYPDIKFGIKLCDKNIGFNGKFYTFPYFLTFMLRRFLKERM